MPIKVDVHARNIHENRNKVIYVFMINFIRNSAYGSNSVLLNPKNIYTHVIRIKKVFFLQTQSVFSKYIYKISDLVSIDLLTFNVWFYYVLNFLLIYAWITQPFNSDMKNWESLILIGMEFLIKPPTIKSHCTCAFVLKIQSLFSWQYMLVCLCLFIHLRKCFFFF